MPKGSVKFALDNRHFLSGRWVSKRLAVRHRAMNKKEATPKICLSKLLIFAFLVAGVSLNLRPSGYEPPVTVSAVIL